MKRLICIWMLLFLLGPAPSAAAETKVMAVTDIHYLAKPLYEGSGLFIQALKNGDGKILRQAQDDRSKGAGKGPAPRNFAGEPEFVYIAFTNSQFTNSSV